MIKKAKLEEEEDFIKDRIIYNVINKFVNDVLALFGVNTLEAQAELKANDCQALAAFLVILKLSMWTIGSFEARLYHSLGQFKDQGYAQRLKECIHSLPSQDLVKFLYNEILSF